MLCSSQLFPADVEGFGGFGRRLLPGVGKSRQENGGVAEERLPGIILNCSRCLLREMRFEVAEQQFLPGEFQDIDDTIGLDDLLNVRFEVCILRRREAAQSRNAEEEKRQAALGRHG